MRRTRAQTRGLKETPTTTNIQPHVMPPPPAKRVKKDHFVAANDAGKPASSATDGMTEYERKRLENIQRNLELMKSLGVSTAKIAARTVAVALDPRKKGSFGPRQPRVMQPRPTAPTRKSSRIQGKQAPSIAIDSWNKPVIVPPPLSEANKARSRLDTKLVAEALNLSEHDNKSLLESIVQAQKEPQEEESEADLIVDATGVETVPYALDANDIVKALDERVYAMAFHPQTDRIVIASGDKAGNLCLWSTQSQHPVNDPSQNMVALYRPHTGPITTLDFTDTTKLLSSSYDGTVREFDLKAMTFTEVFATKAADDQGLTSMARIDKSDPHSFMLSCDDGQVWSIDTRMKTKAQSFSLHEKKINTVDVHPQHAFCMATASLDRTVKLWDIRKLNATKLNDHPLVVMPHARSVNCAQFSPRGEHLVTVCQDDYVYLYDTNDAKHEDPMNVGPTLSIPHNNKTGRWLTKFYAAWDPKRTDQFVIGCLQQPRRIQLFNATRKNPIQELRSEYFNSVHSINVFHPTLELIAGGNSSGRLCLWRKSTRRSSSRRSKA